MNQFLPLLIGINVILALLLAVSMLYLLSLRKKAAQLQREKSLLPPPLSNKEGKARSRSRDIAIIVPSKKEDVIELITEFTETMRENGSFLYHFTNYWGVSDQKETQRIVIEAMNHKSHGIFSVGTNLTKLIKNIGITQNKFTPVVFSHVSEEAWSKTQEKHPVTHMTGMTMYDDWHYRIKMYLYIKPFMRSALVPITHPTMHESALSIVAILQNYGVNAHPVSVHGCDELLQTLSHYSDEVDSIILTRDSLSLEACNKLAKKCSEYGITLFSPYFKDIHFGAAVAMNTVNEQFGMHAARQMLAILEENKSPHLIPVQRTGHTNPYEIQFNQVAMKTQGLDVDRITTLTLQYGSKIHTSLEKEPE